MALSGKIPGVYTLDLFGKEVLAAFSGREFDAGRRRQFLEKLEIVPGKLVSVRQEHTTDILLIDRETRDVSGCVADGLITRETGIPLSVRTADCLPVFYWDPKNRAAGIAHAGWKGLYKGIVAEMLRRMNDCFSSNPKELMIAFGPAIRKCCYEVGEEFRGFFPGFYFPPSQKPGAAKSRGHVDLIAAAKDQLLSAGVLEGHIDDCGICTFCETERFFSARRGYADERILSVIQIMK